MTQRIALLTALLCIIAPVGTASADWRTDRAQAVAAKAWGDPCGGDVRLVFSQPPSPSWRAWSYPAECAVALSDAAPWLWKDLCPALIHEYGHLAGFRDPANAADPFHSADPESIMWPFLHSDPRCARHGEEYLGLEPAALPSRSRKACRRRARRKACRARVARALRSVAGGREG
jgi:hypothetical protein